MIICLSYFHHLALALAHEGLNEKRLEYIACQACSTFPCAINSKGIRLRLTKGEARMRHHH